MDLYHIEPLDRGHNNDILNVLKSAPNRTENLTVCFDRQPDFFKLAEIRYNPFYYYGYFRLKDLKGICGIGYHKGMVNGASETLFHMRDYYVCQEARGKGFGLKVTENFYRKTYNGSVLGYVVIMTGNRGSLSYVGHRNVAFPYIPFSRIINQLDVRNIMLIWPVLTFGSYNVRKAEAGDIPGIVTLLNNEHKERLFGKIFNEATFEDYLKKCPGLSINDYYLAFSRSGRLCGVCAAWDCHSFKQTRVLEYGRKLKRARAAYNALSLLFRVPSLPVPGDSFKDVIITDYAVHDRDPKIMNILLRSVYKDFRKLGYQNILWGCSADDPLLQATTGFFYQRVVSNIVLISTQSAMLENGAVNNRFPYIDLPSL